MLALARKKNLKMPQDQKHLLEGLVAQYARTDILVQRHLIFKARQMNNIWQILQQINCNHDYNAIRY